MKRVSALTIAVALCGLLLSPLFERIAQSQGPSTPPVSTTPPKPKGKFRRVLSPVPGQYNVALDQSTLGLDVASIAADLARVHQWSFRLLFGCAFISQPDCDAWSTRDRA
jgi:hypothetical protein